MPTPNARATSRTLKQYIKNANFQYHIDYKYSDYNCSGCYGCETGNDYCRGASYGGLRAEPNDNSLVAMEQLGIGILSPSPGRKGFVKLSPYQQFLFRTLLKCVPDEIRDLASDSSSYYVATMGGYYGEEINKITLENAELINHISKSLQAAQGVDNDEAVRQALLAEYGRLIGEDEHYELRFLRIDNIENSNVTIDPQLVEEYLCFIECRLRKTQGAAGKSATGSPIAVVRKTGPRRWRVIDGNHHLAAAKKQLEGQRKFGQADGDCGLFIVVKN